MTWLNWGWFHFTWLNINLQKDHCCIYDNLTILWRLNEPARLLCIYYPNSYLINNPNLIKSLQPLSHRHLVGDLSIFYRYFHGHCSQKIKDIIPVPLRRVRTTRSSTRSHPFQVSLPNPRSLSKKSSFIPRACNLWNVLPSSSFHES